MSGSGTAGRPSATNFSEFSETPEKSRNRASLSPYRCLKNMLDIEVWNAALASASCPLFPENLMYKRVFATIAMIGVVFVPALQAQSSIDEGIAAWQSGNRSLAIQQFSNAISESPRDVTAYRLRGSARLEIGQYRDAESDFRAALRNNKHDAGAMNDLAWILATSPIESQRQPEIAVALAKTACRETPVDPAHVDTLAAALASAGDFKAAVEQQKVAIASSLSDEQRKDMESRLRLYEKSQPYYLPVRQGDKPAPTEAAKPATDGTSIAVQIAELEAEKQTKAGQLRLIDSFVQYWERETDDNMSRDLPAFGARTISLASKWRMEKIKVLAEIEAIDKKLILLRAQQ